MDYIVGQCPRLMQLGIPCPLFATHMPWGDSPEVIMALGLFFVLTFVLTISALDLRLFDVDPPQITTAPSRKAVNLRLGKRGSGGWSVPACATSCIASVIRKSTSCSIGDRACECQSSNGYIIEVGAEACVERACGGYLSALSACFI
jgi:CFEM domain